MVILNTTLFGKGGLDGVSCRIVVDVLQGNGPVHDGADALSDTPCGFRLGCPDGGEHVYHLPAGDLVHLQGSKNRKGVGLKSREPLRPVLGVPPGVTVLGNVLPGQSLEAGHFRKQRLFLLPRQRVAAGLRQGATLPSLLSSLSQRHPWIGAQSPGRCAFLRW